MSVDIKYYGGPSLANEIGGGSGLAFMGDSGWGNNVAVGSFQGRTFISNSDGTIQGPECPNVKRLNAASGILGQAGTGIGLTAIPNAQATVRISLQSPTPIRAESCRAYIYDRVSVNNPPTGMTAYAAELIHTNPTQGNTGSGDTTWQSMAGTGSYLTLAQSPGSGGYYAGNGSVSTHSGLQHDWYIAVSCSADVTGASYNSLMFTTEYL